MSFNVRRAEVTFKSCGCVCVCVWRQTVRVVVSFKEKTKQNSRPVKKFLLVSS